MSNQRAAQISLADAEKLNSTRTDAQKVAFQNEQGTEYYTYEDIAIAGNIPHTIVMLTPSVVDGTFPVFKRRKMYPR